MQGAAGLGAFAFCLFLACIPVANWLIGNVGTVCVPGGPCLIPVAPGLMAPSGVIVIGAAFVLRDVVHRLLGPAWTLLAIGLGALASSWLAPPTLILASCAAFLLGELVDFAVYAPLARRRLLLAVVASSVVGLAVDSMVFLYFAFGNLDYLSGQIVGKAWALSLAYPLVRLMRRVSAVAT